MITDITIDAANITSAAEILSTKSGYEDVPVELIAEAFSQHLEGLIEEILHDPESYFSHDYQLWKKIDAKALEAESAELEIAA